jgi:amiloride-sensitive sodium channel
MFAQFCNPWLFTQDKMATFNETVDGQDIQKLRQIAIRFDQTFIKCDFGDEMDKNCGKLFRETMTDDGICYTFNSIAAEELLRKENLHSDFDYSTVDFKTVNWTLDDGYGAKAGINTYPFRVLGAGERAGLNIVLKMEKSYFDYVCKGPVQGYKITMHNPAEYPQPAKHYFRIPAKREVIVSVKPQMIKTSDNLLNYSPASRQCYFSHERYLKYFKVYTQKNCELECLANYTLTKCGCVKFYMPRQSDTPMCSLSAASCYLSTEYDLLQNNLESGDECNCLPDCTSIQYNSEVSSAKFDVEKEKLARGKYSENLSNYQYSKVTIFFENTQFISAKRSELYGLTDFVANCGGVLGLFMGVSLVSIVEIIYYCTIRPINALRKRRAEALNKLTLKISKIEGN